MTANMRSCELTFCKRLQTLQTPLPAVRWVRRVDSTNDALKRERLGGELPRVLGACEQTAGRGRTNRTFYSPRGGLYFSIAFPADCICLSPDSLSAAAGVAVAQTLASLCGEPFAVKWVNDVLYRGKKVCGILCESVSSGAAPTAYIVGIGVNCSAKAVGDFMPDKVGVAPVSSAPPTLAAEIYARLSLYVRESDRSVFASYNALHVLTGKTLQVRRRDGEIVAATVERASASGLHCITAAGEEIIARTANDIVTDLYAAATEGERFTQE